MWNKILRLVAGKKLVNNWYIGKAIEDVKQLFAVEDYSAALEIIDKKLNNEYRWPIVEFWRYEILIALGEFEEANKSLDVLSIHFGLSVNCIKKNIGEIIVSASDDNVAERQQEMEKTLVGWKKLCTRVVRPALFLLFFVGFAKIIGTVLMLPYFLMFPPTLDLPSSPYWHLTLLSISLIIGTSQSVVLIIGFVFVTRDSLVQKFKYSIFVTVYDECKTELKMFARVTDKQNLIWQFFAMMLLVALTYFCLPKELEIFNARMLGSSAFWSIISLSLFVNLFIYVVLCHITLILSLVIGVQDYCGKYLGYYKQKILGITLNLLCIIVVALLPNLKILAILAAVYYFFLFKKIRSVTQIFVFHILLVFIYMGLSCFYR